jgi:hypothetical protein
VVDAAGKPLVVYHGTREDFHSFAPSQAGGGMYFTTNPDLAGAYSLKYGKSKVDAEFTSLRAKLESEGVSKWEVHQQPEWKALEVRARVEGTSVVPVHLSIRRPYEMRGDVDSDRVNAIKDSPAEIAKLKANGYDGIVVRNALDRPNVPYSKADAAMAAKRADLWVAFEPTQVKSAIGNRGTFDPKNPDLRLAAPVYPVPPDDAFAVEPKEAIQYFRNLAPGTVLPKGFEAKHRRTAFSLAVTTDETLLKRVHEVLLQKLQTGERKAGAWDFAQTMDDLGLSTRNPQYAELCLRTNAMDAYNDGYERQVRDDPAIRGEFPYWEYLGIDDDRMGEDHRVNLTGGVNGTAYYPADRTFDEVRGERAENCRCGMRHVHTSEAEAEGLPIGGAE